MVARWQAPDAAPSAARAGTDNSPLGNKGLCHMYSPGLVSGHDHAGRVASALLIGCFALFLWSPIRHLSDAKYSLLLSESLLRLNGPSLEAFLPQFGEAEPTTQLPSQLRRIGGHIHYLFPPGTSMLTVPLLGALRLFGISVVLPNGSFSEDDEEIAHGLLAALLGAGIAMLFFLIANEFIDVRVAVVVALAGALGSPVWSTASRVLWSHTWSLFLLSLVLLILVRSDMGAGKPLSAIGLGFILVAMFVVRPTNAIACVLIALYCISRRLVRPVPFLGSLLLLLMGFSAYSWTHLGGPIPFYFQPGRLSLATVWQGLAGNLFSPSRGLFVYVPLIPLVILLTARNWRRLTQPRLAALLVCGIVGEVLPPALFPHWYGGHSFGARLTMGAVPWAMTLAAMTIHTGSPWPRSMIAGVTGVVGFSIWVHARGVTSPEVAAWNVIPTPIERQLDRLWDWRYPPFLSGLVRPPKDLAEPYAIGGLILLGSPEAERYLGEGWSWPESAFRWTESDHADLSLAVDKATVGILRMQMHPRPAPLAGDQPVVLELNGKRIASLSLARDRVRRLAVATQFVQGRNDLRWILPDGVMVVDGSPPRHLGVAVHWISVEPVGRLEAPRRIDLHDRAADLFLVSGFSYAEAGFRWIEGPVAEIAFRLSPPVPSVLLLELRPFLAGAALSSQTLAIEINGKSVGSLEVTEPSFREYSFPVSRSVLAPSNILRIIVSNPTSPSSLGISGDQRRLGVALRSVTFPVR
jgi:hypothetical protein